MSEKINGIKEQEQQESNTLSKNQINNIIFGTLYKRKISIKDWLYTKSGFGILLLLLYLFLTNSLDGQNIAVVLALALWLYNREKTLAHEKEKLVWLIKYKKWIFQKLNEIEKEQLKKKSKFIEAKEILQACIKEDKSTTGERKKIRKRRKRSV